MGMSSISHGGAGGRRRRSRRYRPMSEINVTPFVDVMLVLLIIFMVTAPLLTVGVDLELPKTNAGPINTDTQPITVSITGSGEIFVQETKIELDELAPKLRAITESRRGNETKIFVKGDKFVNYDIVAKVLGEISSAGYVDFTLSSLPKDGS